MIKCFIAVLLGSKPHLPFRNRLVVRAGTAAPRPRELAPASSRAWFVDRALGSPAGGLPRSRCSCDPTARVSSRLPAGDFRGPAGKIDASKRRTVWCRVSGHIEIGCVALFRRKLRVWQQRKLGDRVEGRFHLVPLDAGVFDPEVGVPMLAPISHLVGIEKLNAKIEAAHRAIFPEVADHLVLQALGAAPLHWARRIVRGRS